MNTKILERLEKLDQALQVFTDLISPFSDYIT